MSAEMARQGIASPITDSALNARLKQIENTLQGPDTENQSIMNFAPPGRALVLARSAENDALREKILDVTRNTLKQPVE